MFSLLRWEYFLTHNKTNVNQVLCFWTSILQSSSKLVLWVCGVFSSYSVWYLKIAENCLSLCILLKKSKIPTLNLNSQHHFPALFASVQWKVGFHSPSAFVHTNNGPFVYPWNQLGFRSLLRRELSWGSIHYFVAVNMVKVLSLPFDGPEDFLEVWSGLFPLPLYLKHSLK